ncbi:phosphoglucomutase/phosphomannomutase family protein [Bacillus sp. FJAT-50079]|uniref:phosphoglucomutase/phosphomannomutase family protein n=1 Tax=Bacillus sp. FJAT-50079 TaxID=2833577 RepID=UPI001BC94F30|nr:phosphoglucomutase/phosphomannomutase family protein [Bacillus sp. FJAT-50079]MBS4208204.1 phosphoglucomutase/phosphomannomutase family protein [Bacillus sp. FJAT-50079]
MIASERISFGTDGWRGKIAETFTFDNVRRAAQGFALFLKHKGISEKGVVIGYDQRFNSDLFARASAEVLAGNGIKVWFTCRNTPTPVISYTVVERQAAGAINITASHNPPEDNGFKVRDSRGAAIPPVDLSEIEAFIPDLVTGVKICEFYKGCKEGVIEIWDPDDAYIKHIKTIVDLEALKNAGKKIVCDVMWGNAAGWYPRLLGGGSNQIIEVHNERNPIFPNMERPEPIHPNIDEGMKRLLEEKGDILFINDGDADRQGIGDENGEYIDQLRVASLLTYYMLEYKNERGAIIKTVNMSSMLDRLAAVYDVSLIETPVGFKYVANAFINESAIIGCEESGGYAFRNNIPERDGILGNLLFLEFMVKTGKTPSELVQMLFEKLGANFYYRRIDKVCTEEERNRALETLSLAFPKEICGFPVNGVDTTDGYKYKLGNLGWLMVRVSGTEPLVRIYCEVINQKMVAPLLQAGLELIGILDRKESFDKVSI